MNGDNLIALADIVSERFSQFTVKPGLVAIKTARRNSDMIASLASDLQKIYGGKFNLRGGMN